jgi:hypothetical protein
MATATKTTSRLMTRENRIAQMGSIIVVTPMKVTRTFIEHVGHTKASAEALQDDLIESGDYAEVGIAPGPGDLWTVTCAAETSEDIVEE